MKSALVLLLAFGASSAMAFDLNLIPHCSESSVSVPEEFYGHYSVKNSIGKKETIIVSDKGVEQVTTVYRTEANKEFNRVQGAPALINVPVKEEVFLKHGACKTYTLKENKDKNTTTLIANIHIKDNGIWGFAKGKLMFHLRFNHESKTLEHKETQLEFLLAWYVLPAVSYEMDKFKPMTKIE